MKYVVILAVFLSGCSWLFEPYHVVVPSGQEEKYKADKEYCENQSNSNVSIPANSPPGSPERELWQFYYQQCMTKLGYKFE